MICPEITLTLHCRASVEDRSSDMIIVESRATVWMTSAMPSQSISTGIDVHYESHGEGEALVLIPATGFAGNVWFPSQVPALSKKLRLITFDPRGCGRSSAP